jgi:hypothetical protein
MQTGLAIVTEVFFANAAVWFLIIDAIIEDELFSKLRSSPAYASPSRTDG